VRLTWPHAQSTASMGHGDQGRISIWCKLRLLMQRGMEQNEKNMNFSYPTPILKLKNLLASRHATLSTTMVSCLTCYAMQSILSLGIVPNIIQCSQSRVCMFCFHWKCHCHLNAPPKLEGNSCNCLCTNSKRISRPLYYLRHYSPGISDLPPAKLWIENNASTPAPQWDLESIVIWNEAQHMLIW